MTYEPTFDSIAQHPLPAWFDDAKLGIFVHWGLYSIPGWAPQGADIDKQVAEKGWEGMFANNPYAEWYLNTVRIGNTPSRQHHTGTYGKEFSYDDFAPHFQQAVEKWDPEAWLDVFQQVGARYLVLTTKHHDGYLLWPSSRTSPRKPAGYASKRDIVGELTQAARKRGMQMGLYYSGGLDWTFNETPVQSYMDVYSTVVQDQDFVEYVTAHWLELIDCYEPSILWNDIGFPTAANFPELVAYYYNKLPYGLVNDRWSQKLPARVPDAGEMINPPQSLHCDFTTPEYAAYDRITLKKWEATRGIGHSFGYSRNEGEKDYLTVAELVRSFVDIVSKNGNLLLNVGPMADGTIPELQRERLLGLGAWLAVNGEAIFSTRPWQTPEGQTTDHIGVRYTQKNDSLYAILLDTPQTPEITVKDLHAAQESVIQLLGYPDTLTWTQHGDNLAIRLPDKINPSVAHTLKITPKPMLPRT